MNDVGLGVEKNQSLGNLPRVVCVYIYILLYIVVVKLASQSISRCSCHSFVTCRMPCFISSGSERRSNSRRLSGSLGRLSYFRIALASDANTGSVAKTMPDLDSSRGSMTCARNKERVAKKKRKKERKRIGSVRH